MIVVEEGCGCCTCRSDSNDLVAKHLNLASFSEAAVFAASVTVNAAEGDIPGDVTTTATIAIGESVTGELEVLGDTDWFRIDLVEGQTVSISLSGSGVSPVSDTYLRIFGSGGGLLATNDDGGDGLNSLLRFTANTTGTYFIEADSWNGQSTGEYTLTVTEAAPLEIYSLDEIAAQLTSGYWGGDERAYSAPTIFYEFVGLSAGEEALALAAMQYWSSVADIKFSPTYDGAFPATLTFQNMESGAWSESSVQYWDGTITTSIVNVSANWFAQNGSTLNSYSYQTYLHELGHALGLGHAGNYNGDASFATDALYLNDSWATTVMSYFDQRDNSYFSQQGFTLAYIGTPMLADIVAIQNLYGVRETRTGDNTYGFNGVGIQDVFDANLYPNIAYTIWDSGGHDTLDYSGFTADQWIDLRAEYYSNIGGNTGNVAIARGVVIEDAKGGPGADTLVGNDVSNALWGLDGNDNIDGGGAWDLLWGGEGDDYLVGNFGNDTIRGGIGNDTLRGGASWDNLFGGPGNDTLHGGNGRDKLYGDSGDDTLQGGSGADLLRGAGGADTLSGGDGDDLIKGEWANDTLLGGNGDDVMFGGDGSDRLEGGSGNDILTGGAGNDVFVFAAYGSGNADIIDDFQRGDKIGLDRNQSFGAIDTLGALDRSTLVYGTEAKDADDRIIYQWSTGKLFYDPDGVGGVDAVLFAQLEPRTDISPQSFLAFGEAAPPTDALNAADPIFA
ncbi:M10 family metallopeptidase C-terminal domain-containing protein [Qipengyuania aurantiaca]|uniref:M10 family metallopeptidase C-terminal domain-containing protein n=1 Tax=Qipengyuania aurantiaca TaxID=2867233 RepID=A0ABX8ZNW5_9SPHN|nr:M10 family metallopeptidase C-terminal domain-containing protein [Qipengyuania aurantiaca]QZD88878.1 M10 family metallopeptidase C-terminal domain-containing protein [Qipengyuania aurantiaca]